MLHEQMTHVRTLFSAMLVVILTGCNVFGPKSCTTVAPPAIAVSVEHAETGEPIDDALVIARDGFFADSARTEVVPGRPHTVALATERPGTYTVLVEKTGFLDWIREDVTATDGGCHVNTVELHAHMVPDTG